MESTITVIFSDLVPYERFRFRQGGTEFFRRGTDWSYSPVQQPGTVYAVSNHDMTVFPAPRTTGVVPTKEQ